MRPLRFLLALLACVSGFTLLIYHGPRRWHRASINQTDIADNSRFGTYFNWRTPSSLFPPSAVISLTDDNSTFFLARPAAFGPQLPGKSLSGQLWIGSGFGDEARHGENGDALEGELGCSDVPGWNDAEAHKALAEARRLASESTTPKADVEPRDGKAKAARATSKDGNKDGTDNHLLTTKGSKGKGKDSKKAHADIQSLQESAEIAGKVVLLSRGGCGFLDKVKWAQRRDAVAVIVGDDIRGGPLVTMYARGDTSNISIPALFTSHTTAHLLSSLMPTGGKNMPSSEELTRLGSVVSGKTATKKGNAKRSESKVGKVGAQAGKQGIASAPVQNDGSGWFWSMFGTEDINGKPSGNRLPPDLDKEKWIMQTEFDENEGRPAKKSKSSKQAKKSKSSAKQDSQKNTDGFVIGVQDWRDPAYKKDKQVTASVTEKTSEKSGKVEQKTTTTTGGAKRTQGWLDRLWNGEAEVDTPRASLLNKANIIDPSPPVSNPAHLHDIHIPGAMYDEPTEHDGLWVTLTPTSMSSSPFFDTLLVLVVSPLVTLTVVYALLLLRSRIRRRRWRAPKSVVERLPVRTYQTMVSSPTSSTTSSISTIANVNTPLLSTTAAQPIRSRPRSRTDSELAQSSSTGQSLEQVEEKRQAGLAEWRRKYGGKQKECVVCLDEYVDGVSQVMSLPCGHEFHKGCITPWLTTRRRTCPICKGDVVRSLARSHGSTSSAHPDIAEEDEDDESVDNADNVQEQAVLTTNNDPSSQIPISRDDEAFEDLERGMIEQPDRNR